jgi:oxygen-independent coproporphyrinogen-3 oxidase
MKDAWIPYALQPVPRYTSYPTAADFSPAVGAAEAGAWLRSVRPDEALSAYVHIPFCEKLCWYCGCATSVPNGYARVAEYVALLIEEIRLKVRATGPHAGIGHLHFGGGTPNSLSAEDFQRVITALRGGFAIRPGAEIAIELDPRTMQDGQVAAMAAAGVTRASLGVQTLAPKVQAAVNRIQPPEMIEALVSALRAAGIPAINMDLMYGLPHQTAEDTAEAARFAASMGAARVSLFGYAHVPWFAKHQRAIEETALPGLEARFAQAEAATGALLAAGYRPIGLDHFAREDDPLARAAAAGHLRRNFQGYTDDPYDTLIAFGATAISQFGEGYVQNVKDRKAWGDAIWAGRLPAERGIALTADDRLRARAIERLMCDMSVDVGVVCAEMGAAPDALYDALVVAAPLAQDGLCMVSSSRITVPEEARLFLRTVARCFDARQPASLERRHAKAV